MERRLYLPLSKVKVQTFPVMVWKKKKRPSNHLNWQLKMLHSIHLIVGGKKEKERQPGLFFY
jgi:hypothetical protein